MILICQNSLSQKPISIPNSSSNEKKTDFSCLNMNHPFSHTPNFCRLDPFWYQPRRGRRTQRAMRRVRWKTSAARCNEFVYNVLLRDEMICLHRQQCQTLFPNSLKWKGDEQRQKQLNSTAGVLHLYILVQSGWRQSSMVIHAKPRDQSLLKSSGFPNQVFPRMRLHSVGGPISPQAGSERSATSLIQAAQCQVRCMTLHRPCTLAAAADRSILGRHKQRKQTIFQP